MWILDDRMPLVTLSENQRKAAAALLPIADTTRWSYGEGWSNTWSASNPPRGARLAYWLAESPKDDIRIDILDAKGRLVDTLSSKPRAVTGASEYADDEAEAWKKAALPKEKGLNVAAWNLNWAGAEMIQNAIVDSGDPSRGPLAAPGAYTARLVVGEVTDSKPFRVLPDPRSTATPAELEAQVALGITIRDAVSDLTRGVRRIQSVRKQLLDRNALLAGVPALATRAKALVESSTVLAARLDSLERRLQNPDARIAYDVLAQPGGAQLYSRLSPLIGWATRGAGAPTQGIQEEFARQRKELDSVLADLATAFADVEKQNAEAATLGVPGVLVPPAE
jgi:hypothetical protein